MPNGVDYGIDWAVLFVVRWWDEQREFADSGKFVEQCFGIQQPRVRQLIGAKVVGLDGLHLGRVCGFCRDRQNLSFT